MKSKPQGGFFYLKLGLRIKKKRRKNQWKYLLIQSLNTFKLSEEYISAYCDIWLNNHLTKFFGLYIY